MFVFVKNFSKSEKKLKKGVDTGGCFVVFYPSAREKGHREDPRGRENLENDTERLEETTVNSEMSFT